MCGIVGAVAERDVTPILVEGLKRLEYRGYDSAGLAVLGEDAALHRLRTVGKVEELERELAAAPFHGRTGIGHTRWATHGVPSEANAHPHISRQRVAVVHNGIIENFQALRQRLEALGYTFQSETDSEAIAHLISLHLDRRGALAPAVRDAAAELEGAYALGVIAVEQPDRLVAVRRGSPLVVGLGIGERFIASDRQALLPVTHRFIDLHDGEVAELTRDTEVITGLDGQPIAREPQVSELSAEAAERGGYRHFMLKEIFEQPVAIANTLQGRLHKGRFVEASLGPGATPLLDQVRAIHIVACGTSFHAGMVARYWLEGLARLPCTVEVASEYRYRRPVVPPGTLFITLSQSGETADTLAALREAKTLGYVGTLAICNVAESSLVRESGLALMTHAGPEIGVASTKAFTTQLAALLLLVVGLGRRHGLDDAAQASMAEQIAALPAKIEETLALSERIEELAQGFAERHHALFLGRGAQYPVAMEGALKLKEISYIHAEAYPAGEIKHGPLALVDDDMPVISVAPNNELLEKLKSNLQEVSARGGRLVVFADSAAVMDSGIAMELLQVAPTHDLVAPVIYTVPLQLLAYHVAVLKGTDVDKPRNLAKSVTVE